MTKSSAALNLSIPNFSLKAVKLLFRKQSNISKKDLLPKSEKSAFCLAYFGEINPFWEHEASE